MLKPTLTLPALLCLLLSTGAVAQTVYVYKDKNGNSVITNRKSSDSSLKLSKSYQPLSPVRTLGSQHYTVSKRRLDPRDTPYDRTIFSLADNYKQDRALIKAIVQIESSFNPNALSPKGAQGLMQLMPATAEIYDVRNPFNAQENLRGGIAHFSYLMKRYNNDIRLALAAYNAGEGAVSRYNGIPPYPETQAYVRHVMRLHRNYQRHGSTYRS